MMNIAFAGFRHGHIYALLEWAKQLPDVNIVAAWEADEHSREVAKLHGVLFTHDSYEEMLKDSNIDVVAIGDYFAARGQKAIQALRAGKHVIADKPLCTDLSELNEIERLAKENGKKVGCMLDLRYRASTAIAKKLIQSGKLGKLHNISFTGQHSLGYGNRAGWYFEEGKQGGTISDIAIHGIDLVRYITGAKLKRVLAARCWNAYATEVPNFKDAAQFMIELDGGIGLIADVSYASPNGCKFTPKQYWRFTYWGENGALEFNYADNIVELMITGAEKLQLLSGEDADSNPLKDFIADINDEEVELNTQSVLLSSRDTLTIQKFALDNE